MSKLYLGDERGYSVPTWFIASIVVWITARKANNEIMRGLLRNDLRTALDLDDPDALSCFPGIMKFMRDEVPEECWGSEEAVKKFELMSEDEHYAFAEKWTERHPEFMDISKAGFTMIDIGVSDKGQKLVSLNLLITDLIEAMTTMQLEALQAKLPRLQISNEIARRQE